MPVTLREANAVVEAMHRHSDPVRGCLFCVGLAAREVPRLADGRADTTAIAVGDLERIRGVAIVGRPVARALQDGFTAEVLRVCTDGVRNGCSMLYGACWRAVQAIGFTRLVTYTLAEEGGASLRASGWKPVAELPARPGWDAPSRQRDNEQYRSGERVRWEKGDLTPQERPPLPKLDDSQESLL